MMKREKKERRRRMKKRKDKAEEQYFSVCLPQCVAGLRDYNLMRLT